MKPKYFELLRILAKDYEVDFVIVGGVAAILEGAPITTLDLDVVYDREPPNLERLANALQSVNAQYRDPAGRRILPDIRRLGSFRMNLLQTDLGPFDALAVIGDGLSYRDLLDSAIQYRLDDFQIQVLGLAKVIELKEFANRDKDRMALPTLRRTLELKNSQASPGTLRSG